ncbi:sensor histidine kinase [Microbispora bryophytorum]|uniref:Two-component sensor histidine kinase n=1 Tax=Microbispora bryophytorum TaxID=1460882 RepID=A0A8H9GVQ0_9ACTN|nr:histidine kinase [Microbispora bryophytorum]GGO04269.1 two-component sensor histidine kinase [Microbispora bryophytorum]
MRLARVIVVVVLAALASVYVIAGAPIALAVFGVQVLYLLKLRTWWLLAAQAVLVYTASLAGGVSTGILGFLAGSLLLTPAHRDTARVLAPFVVASAALIDAARGGATADATITVILVSLVVFGLTRLVERAGEMHAARLSLAAAAVAAERLRLAAELNDGLGRSLEVIVEGGRRALAEPDGAAEVLASVTATARAALADARAASANYRATSLAPELVTARAMLDAAGIAVEVRGGHTEPLGPGGALLANVLREAVTDVVRRGTPRLCVIETSEQGDERGNTVRLRVVDDGHRTAEGPDFDGLRLEEAGGTLTTGLSPSGRFVVEATLPRGPSTEAAPSEAGAGEAGAGGTGAGDAHAPEFPAGRRRRWPLPKLAHDASYAMSVAVLAAVLVGFSAKTLLQLDGPLAIPAAACLAVIVVMQLRSVNGRHMVALTVMAVLTYAPIPVFGPVWLGAAGFLAGPVLLAFPWRAAWPTTAAIVASVAAAGMLFGLPAPVLANSTLSALVTGLVVYALLRLAQIVKELQAARESLARSAIVEERLRAARDLHDLLGHSLAAILLTCELARRLKCPRERIEEIAAMAEGARADLRSVSGEQRELSLAAEVESARTVLSAAGIRVTVEPVELNLPAEVETVLGTVLREAVTNVLRHSEARHCAITMRADERGLRLRVRNDGVSAGKTRRGSSGIGNLTTRLAALDGRLASHVDGDRFTLDACVPHRAPVPAQM